MGVNSKKQGRENAINRTGQHAPNGSDEMGWGSPFQRGAGGGALSAEPSRLWHCNLRAKRSAGSLYKNEENMQLKLLKWKTLLRFPLISSTPYPPAFLFAVECPTLSGKGHAPSSPPQAPRP